MKFASGKRAWGECARSGRRMKLVDMIEDPRTGMLVDPSWAEPCDPEPPDVDDGVGLSRMSPSRDVIPDIFYPGDARYGDDGELLRPISSASFCGTIQITVA